MNIEVVVRIGVLGKEQAITDRIVQFVACLSDCNLACVGLKGFSNKLGKETHKAGVNSTKKLVSISSLIEAIANVTVTGTEGR